ncbi:cell division protein FtsA [candidate division WOR-3 bacterium]|nr:cell division protein FtsA [candidate division WOR-3 bacterium]
MKDEIIAGLDLGTTKTVCLIAKSTNGTLLFTSGGNGVKQEDIVGTPETSSGPKRAFEIIGKGIVPSTGLHKGVVVDLEHTAESIRLAVSKASQQAQTKIKELYVNVAGDHIKIENSQGIIALERPDKQIIQEDVKEVIEQAKSIQVPTTRQIIHTIPLEFIVDEQSGIKVPDGMSGNRLKVNIYIITGAIVPCQNIYKSVNRAEFKVRDLILQPMASAYAVLEPDEQELGCVLIDIGGTVTDVAVFYEDKLRDTFAIPLGGIDITNDISIGLRTPRSEAERIKLNYAIACRDLADDEIIEILKLGGRGEQTIEKKLLASIIEPRLEEIFSLIYRKISRDVLQYAPTLLPAGVILTGATAKMPGIKNLAEYVLKMPVRIGIPNPISHNSQLTTVGVPHINYVRDNTSLQDPAYATSIGLITYALSQFTSGKTHTMGNPAHRNLCAGHLLTRVAERMKKWLLE